MHAKAITNWTGQTPIETFKNIKLYIYKKKLNEATLKHLAYKYYTKNINSHFSLNIRFRYPLTAG